MEKVLADLGLTQPQYAIMTILNAYPGCSNADLARVAMLTPQTLSVIVTNLQKAGLIDKTPHLTHGRVRNIALTDPGRAVHAQARQRVRKLEDEIGEGFTEAEQRVVRRWLAQLGKGAAPPPRSDEPAS